MKKSEYSVTYAVKAIISIDVKADSREDAIQKAEQTLRTKGLFADNVDYLDGSYDVIGTVNQTEWQRTTQ